ncbi:MULTISPECIES: hypothetical protein [Pacificibacter]|uniref:hypothetical protein n=1 Tax=Pacificibacter TaxID=1042323 RepID=UPI001C09FE3B|nr:MULTISPECIES: hypothetical protein [Pacificibacter]MBU2936816.1 hypothetical protein [Pacificibacter marinus]MDO6614808.1 hypothetical protein [Pacificibacter sp. 1_MG-2023]
MSRDFAHMEPFTFVGLDVCIRRFKARYATGQILQPVTGLQEEFEIIVHRFV